MSILASTQSHIALAYCSQESRGIWSTTTVVYCVLLLDSRLSWSTATEVYCVLLRSNHLSLRVAHCSFGPVTHLPLYTEMEQIVTILRLRYVKSQYNVSTSVFYTELYDIPAYVQYVYAP